MSLTAGSAFGVYTVGPLLGSGGMGEVYQARDTRLGRNVALKVLPDAVAQDHDRLTRFTREAQALAALNHPHIAQIYGIEEVDARGALVLELVDGPTLADRLVRGALPLDEVLTIAVQIAQALEAAHDAGIVHRDLKPANIKVTPAGVVKVLDFGLAKIYSDDASSRDVSLSPTISAAATRAGVIMGTAAYMSPEQARGGQVDKRADVWAFGCVLFEMLSGRIAFGAETVPDTVVKVLSLEPDLQQLPRGTPTGIVSLLKRCLQKDPARRLRDIADARLQIDEIASGPVADAADVRRSSMRWALVGWIVAAFAVATLATVVALRPAAPIPETIRLAFVTLPSQNPFRFALSPDARSVVYEGSIGGDPGLWVRSFDQVDGRALMGTARVLGVFWSPDSRSIGFIADGSLKRVDVDSGFVRTIAPAINATAGAAWGGGDTILFGSSSGPLYRVPADGGTPQQVTTLTAGQSSHRFPQFLPDGKRFLFLALGTPEARGIYLASLDAKSVTRVVAGEFPYAFLAPSHVLLAKDGALWAQQLSKDYTRTAGALEPVAPRVFVHGVVNGLAAISASASGSLAYRAAAPLSQLVWVDRSGREIAALTDSDDSQWDNLSLSPDGTRLAVRRMINGNTDVWVVDTARGQPRRLTVSPAVDGEPVFSPDGLKIAYASDPKDTLWDVHVKAADGTGSDAVLMDAPENESPRDWSPDGKYLLVAKQSRTSDFDLWAFSVAGDKKPFAVAETPFAENDGRFSPDGASIAFSSNETGREEIFVEPFPGPGARVQISNGGGRIPRWRRDGKELYYIAADLRLMAIEMNGSFVARGAPRPLFPMSSPTWYVPSAEGTRFLIRKTVSPETPLTVVLNWKPSR